MYTKKNVEQKTSHIYANLIYTEIHVEIYTMFIRFYRNFDYNFIQYQILHASLQDFICMERTACHKIFPKGQNVNILTMPHVHWRRFRTVSVDTRVLGTVQRHSVKRVCWKKSIPLWCDYDTNQTILQWS